MADAKSELHTQAKQTLALGQAHSEELEKLHKAAESSRIQLLEVQTSLNTKNEELEKAHGTLQSTQNQLSHVQSSLATKTQALQSSIDRANTMQEPLVDAQNSVTVAQEATETKTNELERAEQTLNRLLRELTGTRFCEFSLAHLTGF